MTACDHSRGFDHLSFCWGCGVSKLAVFTNSVTAAEEIRGRLRVTERNLTLARMADMANRMFRDAGHQPGLAEGGGPVEQPADEPHVVGVHAEATGNRRAEFGRTVPDGTVEG